MRTVMMLHMESKPSPNLLAKNVEPCRQLITGKAAEDMQALSLQA